MNGDDDYELVSMERDAVLNTVVIMDATCPLLTFSH